MILLVVNNYVIILLEVITVLVKKAIILEMITTVALVCNKYCMFLRHHRLLGYTLTLVR